MNYEVTISRNARRSIDRISRRDQSRILDRIAGLGSDPRPHGAIALTGVDGWRLRVGDYRVVYTIDDTVRIVNVTSVGHRREIYRRL